MTEIKAEVPMAEMLAYAPDLRSITGGQGEYTMEFERYEEVPGHLAGKVVEAARRGRRPVAERLARRAGQFGLACRRAAVSLMPVLTARHIRSQTRRSSCDVCGRTLLRGERAETYLAGGQRRKAVCELCTAGPHIRAGSARAPRPRGHGARAAGGERRACSGAACAGRANAWPGEGDRWTRLRAEALAAESRSHAPRDDVPRAGSASSPGARAPHVHAVPTSGEMKASRALDLFNASEHPRTVAGVARSLGAPAVAVRPAPEQPSVVTIVVSWELCWYRYEVDLADEGAHGVHLAGPGL